MAYSQALTQFAQSVYLTIKNRYFDDIASDDGQTYIAQVIDWTNQFLDELEQAVDLSGEPVDWRFMQVPGFALGTATTGESAIDLDSSVQAVVSNPNRCVQVSVDNMLQSSWEVVTPGQMKNTQTSTQPDRVAVVGTQLVFSRSFRQSEDGGTITGDVVVSLPRLSDTNTKALTIVKPKLLLVLGVAKNATLPDIVQGGLSPSYVQKYNDVLQGAIARNNASSVADTVLRDNYSYIGGVGF